MTILLTILVGAFVLAALQLLVLWLQHGAYAPETLEVAHLALASVRVHIRLVQDVVPVLFARCGEKRIEHVKKGLMHWNNFVALVF